MSYMVNTYTADDIRKLKEEMKKLPVSLSRAGLAKKIGELWKKDPEVIERWLVVAESFSEEVIDLFDAGKINRNRLQAIARGDYVNPSYKDFVAKKAIEENLSKGEIDQIRVLIQKGRHPMEAIDILRGRRPERPITRNDELSIDKIVKELEKDGFSFRQRFEVLRAMGKIQILQNGQLKDRLAYTIAAMKVIADDMKRFTDEMWAQVPKETQEAVAAEFRDDPSPREDPEPGETEIEAEIQVLPAPDAEPAEVAEEGGIGSAT